MMELRDFVPKFLPLYHLVAAVSSPTRWVTTANFERQPVVVYTGSNNIYILYSIGGNDDGGRVDSGHLSGRFIGRDAQNRTNSGRRREALSHRP